MSEEIKLTPQQVTQWGDTMSLMGWTCPGFQHLFYKLLSHGETVAYFTKDIERAATDGVRIYINPEWFFALPLQQRVFVLAHEVCHPMLNDITVGNLWRASETVPMHDGTTLGYDNNTMNRAMDFRINPMLIDSRIGKPPENLCYDPKVGTADDSVLDIYKKIYEDDQSKGKSFDLVLAPGKKGGQPAPRNAQQWAVEVQAAAMLESMKHQGQLPGTMKRFFDDILNPKIPWTEHIRTIINRRVGSGGYDWKRPDRRFIVRDIYMPSRSGHGAGWLVVWGDTSGSMGAPELSRNIAELSGIIEDVRPRRLTVLWCDAAISHIDELKDAADLNDVRCRGVGGGGGTSMNPVMDWIGEQLEQPDMLVCFTDGYVTFPMVEPSFPVIWASSTDVKYPWGEVVRVD